MKNQTSIEVTLGADGTVQVEAVGYKGKDCIAATKFIEAALGLEPKSKKKKKEWYETNTTNQRGGVRIGG